MCHADNRVTTCLENLEMSGNLTAVRDFTLVREKILSGKHFLKLFAYLHPYGYLVGVYSMLNIKYMILDHALLHFYNADSNASTFMI